MKHSGLTILALTWLASCSPSPPQAGAPVSAPSAPPPYNTEVDVEEIMVHVFDPEARAFFSATGTMYDVHGEHDIGAKTDEEWKTVEDGATGLLVGTNTLLLPEYQRKPEAEWIKYAKEVADLSVQGRDSADKKDKAALAEISLKLDVACDACHEAFRKEAK